MKRALLMVLLISFHYPGNAQQYPSDQLAENRIDEATHDTIRRSYWQVMERASLSRKLNTFYRISKVKNKLYLDLKVTQGGAVFVIPRGAELELMLENDNVLVLHSSEYRMSCSGCGARGWANGGLQGVVVSYEINEPDLRALLKYYIVGIGIHTGERYLEKQVTQDRSDLFLDELKLVHFAE